MSSIQSLPVRLVRSFADKRRSRRYSCGGPVEVRDSQTGALLATGSLHDVSRGGMACVLPHPVTAGSVVTVQTPHFCETATVRHSSLSEAGYIVGCEFRNPLLALWF